jgi:hypothetical protein
MARRSTIEAQGRNRVALQIGMPETAPIVGSQPPGTPTNSAACAS